MWSRLVALVLLIVLCTIPGSVAAQANEQAPFSIQVTPSPIIETLTPGQQTTIRLSIRNNSTATEKLKIEARTFTANTDASQITLGETTPRPIIDWIRFSDPSFQVRSGEAFTETITIDTPRSAGFSYAFALVVSRANEKPVSGGTTLRGSVAVFTLLNVDREGATRSFELESFTTPRRMYEYLPAEFVLTLKNTGNTIAQPYGTIYIQRHKNDATPIVTLPINNTNGSVLPDTTRSFTTEWASGFPVFVSDRQASNAQQLRRLDWDWSSLDKLRIGRYTAKAVVVYNDGGRDVPIEAVLEFWVMPWKLLLVVATVVALTSTGLFVIVSRIVRIRFHKKKRKKGHAAASPHEV